LVNDPLRVESNDPTAGVNEPSERHREDTDIRAHFQDRHSRAGELLKKKHLVPRNFAVLVERASNVGVVDGVEHRTFAALLEPDVLACPERLYVHTDILASGVCAGAPRYAHSSDLHPPPLSPTRPLPRPPLST